MAMSGRRIDATKVKRAAESSCIEIAIGRARGGV